MSILRCLIVLLLFSFPQTCFSQQVSKELITSEGKKRAYYLFVPDKLSASQPLPLIVLLHGSGRNGLSLVDKWKDLGKKENVILVGPDALDSGSWRIPEDGPDALQELIEALKMKYPVNERRIYMFGRF